MKTTLRILAVTLLALASANASAQESVKGYWQITEVRGNETPEEISFSISFEDEGKATVVYESGDGAAQTWRFAYTVEDKTLTLKPTNAPGTPEPTTYEMRFGEKQLELLRPMPEPEEGDPTPEDNREPVWVLSRK